MVSTPALRRPDNRELYLCNARHGVIAMAVSGKWSVVTDTVESRKLVCPTMGLYPDRGLLLHRFG